jgi:hypothetical protein
MDRKGKNCQMLERTEGTSSGDVKSNNEEDKMSAYAFKR